MVHLSTLVTLLGSSALVAAAPGTALDTRASCTFTSAATAKAQKASCSTIVLNGITVPAGTTLDLTGLTAGTKVIFEGHTTFGYSEWAGPLVSISGKDITVTGASGNSIDGGGAKYWDGYGSNGKGKVKPKFFAAHKLTGSSSITGLNFLNSPVQCISISQSVGLSLYNIKIDNSAGDTNSLGHNTDGFDINLSSNIYISGATVKNQDDCVAVNSGTNITFTGGYCSGGHGLSVGSVGGRSGTGANIVKDVKFLSSTITKSTNGVRVKTVSGTTGSVSGVTYQDITLDTISKYGIVIQQDYLNGSPTGIPTTGVPITGLTLKNVHGSVSGGQNVYILCAACSSWSWSGISVTGGKVKKTCAGIPSGSGASC